jgi:DNA-binding MarR family transcriptional regulator
MTRPPTPDPSLEPRPQERIRELVNRRTDAAAQHRAAFGRLLDLNATEAAAVLHIGRSGQLRPGDLARRLGLTSGGVTALVHRLERSGHVRRHAHPRDRRSTLLSLTPATVTRASETLAPLVADLDAVVERLPATERAAVIRFLERTTEIAERHADALSAAAGSGRRPAPPAPGLWA